MSDQREQIVDTRLDALSKSADHLEQILGVDGVVDEALAAADNGDTVTDRLTRVEARLASIETQLEAIQDLGREKTTKEEKVAAIVQYAQNTATDPKADRVVIKAREVKGVAGVSRRYAYDLIDDLPGEFKWLHDQSDVSQYGDLQIDKNSQVKAIVVDLEQLHTDESSVNKFTTRNSREGVSA